MARITLTLAAGVVASAWLTAASQSGTQAPADPQAPPRILFTGSLRALEYQLSRLSPAELAAVERRDDDRKFRPVYVALLTRNGVGREYFDEALAALAKMDGASTPAVLLSALPHVADGDADTAEKILRVLFSQPRTALQAERSLFAAVIEKPGAPAQLQAAYGAIMLADGGPDAAWQLASARDEHLEALLRSVPLLAHAPGLRETLLDRVATVAAKASDPATRAAALNALAAVRKDVATFRVLAAAVREGGDDALRLAAIRAMRQLPPEVWPPAEIEPLARAIGAYVEAVPPERRNTPAIIEAVDLGGALAAALPLETRRAVRRDLRALAAQIVRIESIPEKMLYDVRWFAVEAGRPVQIVLVNPDVMPHNLLIVRPGSLQEVGTLAGTMSLPSDPKAKAYVPDSPLVLQATRLLNWGETERLGFLAPKTPGEYPFVCTFPGHWVRMNGIMLVVEDLEKWEANPTVPIDPMTKKPFAGKRNQ
jgi:hypothetical protein